MADLFRVLGYHRVIDDLSEALRADEQIELVHGPPGAGKSSLVKEVGRQWEAAGGVTLIAIGDSGRSSTPLYPFGYALGGLSAGWRALAPVAAGAGRIAEGFLGTRGAITATVELLAKLPGGRKRRHSRFLGEAAQQALHNVEHLGKRKPILFVADNLHWWDGPSLDLLRMLQSQELREAYPFLSKMRIVAVETDSPYQEVIHRGAHDDLLAVGRVNRFALRRAPRESFRDVMLAFGAPADVAPGVADEIYTLSGGHLLLAQRASEYLKTHGPGGLLSAADSDEFRRTLLTERVYSLGTLGRDATAMLQVASFLGLTFRQDEILCAYGGQDGATRRLLRRCRDERVLEYERSSYHFVHDLLRQYFSEAGGGDPVAIHEQLALCLRTLQPGDYQTRCVNALRAEQTTEAGTFAVQAALQAHRDGAEDPSRALPPELMVAISDAGLDAVLESLLQAWSKLVEYDFASCLRLLDQLPHGLGRSLLAEADYIRSGCLMATRSEKDRAAGRRLLSFWSGLEETEPELGFRLMRQLLYGLAMTPDKSEAHELEHRLRRGLEARTTFDATAIDNLYILDRCAGSLDPPDVALIRTREAVRHFAPAVGEASVRRPLEYYRCLINLGANLICNSRYGEAVAVYEDARVLVADYAPGSFPRLDYLYANQLLAEYRSGGVTAAEAVERQREIVTRHGNPDDPFYLGNGLAVYLTLAGRAAESLDIFAHLRDELRRTRIDAEPSMRYLLGSNEIVARFLADRSTDPAEEWAALTPLLDEVAYTTVPYLKRRHALLGEAFAEVGPLTPDDLDRYAVKHYPAEFGPLWDNFGRALRMPEVEFWRES